MKNARLDEAQAGIKIARRNINNLSYSYGTRCILEPPKINLLLFPLFPHLFAMKW